MTGYDSTDAASGEPDSEIYLYDANPSGPGKLTCISCNPTGARPFGRAIGSLPDNKAQLWAAATLPGWQEQLRPTRFLADDGAYLFFQSFEALVPADTNGGQDVYEWQRASSEVECRQVGAGLYSESADGCISLLSSGQSPEDSELLDASENGRNLFIATGASLLPQDPAWPTSMTPE